MLLAILAIYFETGTTDIPSCIRQYAIARRMQPWLWLAFFASFAVKVPDVAGAYLAARRPRRGADRRLGDPGRRAAENGRLRLPALLAAHAARGLGRLHAADLSRCRSSR